MGFCCGDFLFVCLGAFGLVVLVWVFFNRILQVTTDELDLEYQHSYTGILPFFSVSHILFYEFIR